MNFLYTFLASFITNYLIIWIISLFSFKNRKIVSLVVISIINIATIVFNALALFEVYVDLASQNDLSSGISYILIEVGNLIANVVAYLATLVLLLDGMKIFKSRRQQQYRNAVKNKANKPAIFAVVALTILGLACLTYAIILNVNYETNLLLAIVGAYGMTLVFFGLAYYIFFINFTKEKNLDTTSTNSNVINATIINKTKVEVDLLFILQLGTNKYYFTGPLDNNNTINTYLGEILNIYVLTDFGNINSPSKKVIVKGIKVDRISEETLKEIKMTRITNPDEKFLNIVSNFERYHLKNIFLDENNNIIKISER